MASIQTARYSTPPGTRRSRCFGKADFRPPVRQRTAFLLRAVADGHGVRRDDQRQREARLEFRFIKARERATRVGGFELRSRVTVAVLLRSVEASQPLDDLTAEFELQGGWPGRHGFRKPQCGALGFRVEFDSGDARAILDHRARRMDRETHRMYCDLVGGTVDYDLDAFRGTEAPLREIGLDAQVIPNWHDILGKTKVTVAHPAMITGIATPAEVALPA